MKARIVLAAASIVLVAGGLALAAPGRYGRHGGMFEHRFERISRELDLTDGQRTRIREIFQQHRDDGLSAAARQVRDAHRDVRLLIQDPASDEASIRGAATRAAQAEADLAVERHKAFVEAFAVLTPEQQEKAKALRAKAAQRRPAI
jgi:Spy/CpxP family protein refolding chaperone